MDGTACVRAYAVLIMRKDCEIMEEKKVTMTKDQIIMELMELLKQNSKEKQANEIYELSAYVESLENKLDAMTSEFMRMSKELSELKMLNASPTIRESLVVSMQKANSRIHDMREGISEIKTRMRVRANEICVEFKKKGKEALNNVSEFFGIREKLETMRDNFMDGIKKTENTLARIEGFEEGIKAANHQLANSFRVLAGKETKKNEDEVYFKNDSSLMLKPWEWQRKVYQSMVQSLNKSIEKVDALSTDVQVQKMMRQWDEIYSRSHDEIALGASEDMALVSEKGREYGADQFEEYMKKQGEKKVGAKNGDVGRVKENVMKR